MVCKIAAISGLGWRGVTRTRCNIGDDGRVDQPTARPWSAPETVPFRPQLSPAGATKPGIGGLGVAEEPLAPELPLLLEPHTIPEIIDGAFNIVRLQPAKVVTVIAAIVVPVDLFVAYLQRSALANGGVIGVFEQALDGDQVEAFGPSGTGLILGYLLPSFALVLVSAALSRLVSGWYGGHDYSAGELFRFIANRWWEWPLVWVLVHLAEAIGALLLIVPGFAVMTVLMLTVPAMAIEDLKPLQAMRRSRTLVKGVAARAFGVAVITAVVVGGLQLALATVPQLVGGLVGETYGWLVIGFGSILSSVLSTAGVAGMTLLLYFDLRVRREALDLEMDAVEYLGPQVSQL